MMEMRNGVTRLENMAQFLIKDVENWIATVTLESNTYKYPDNDAGKNAHKNADRMKTISKITHSLAEQYHGQGIVLYSGGYFHSGTDEVERSIASIIEQIQQVLQGIYDETSSSIVVCLGIDGKVLLEEGPAHRYDANQVSLAISKDGLIAYGKKFYATDDIEAQVVDLATDYLSPAWLGNTQYHRTFTHGGRSFYLAECNDIKGLRNYPKPESVNCILNCVHGCYNRDDGPTCSYFVRLNFAGTSMAWKCPVFGSVVFFKREIAEKWRTGMLYRMWDRDPIQCDTDDNALAPIQTDSSFILDEGHAQVDVYNLDTVFSGNPEYRNKSRAIRQDAADNKSVSKDEGKPLPPSPALNIYTRIRSELDRLFSGSVIDQTTKFTYRGRNTLGYPRRTELDMISLSKPSSSNIQAVKFRIYPYVLARHLNLKNPEDLIAVLPAESVLKHERENPHPAEVFFAGSFSNEHEIEKFVLFLQSAEGDIGRTQ